MFNNMSINVKAVGLSTLTWGVMMGAALSCGHANVATWIFAGAGFVVALGGGLWLGKSVSGRLAKATSVVNAIVDERWDHNIDYKGKDEVGALVKSLNLLKSKWQVKWKNLQSNDSASGRVQAALDSVTANVMMADENFNIVYTNKAVVEMLRHGESDIRKDLPNFSASNLIGTSIDQFHKNPEHQRRMVNALSQTHRGDIEVGGRTFGLVATPIFNQQNKRLGTVVEWHDKTEELAREEEEKQRQAEMDKVAADNARVKQALDAVTANVMVADAENNIIYMNNALNSMLNTAQADIRKDIPSFDARNLMGVNMDQFHKNPAHQQRMVRELTSTFETRIVAGGRTFKLVANPVVSDSGERLGTAVEWADLTEELHRQEEERMRQEQESKVAAENARVRQALDAVTTNVVVADDNYDIVYLNHAAKDMLSKAQSDIRKELPNFDATRLVGVNMDEFHKNPAHQRRMAESLTSTLKTQIEIGGRTFALVATPVFGEDGKKLGVTVEWNDRTLEVAVEEEVSDIVSAAAKGNLERRISMEGKEGFFKTVSSGINQLTSICDNVIKDTVRVLGSMARGDLSQRITADYEGAFAQLKSDANSTTSKFQEIISEIRNASDAVQSGASEISAGNQSLSQRTEEQASSLEETASSMEEMTSTIKQNADNANQANQLASSARSHAEQGGEVVNKAVTAMEEINNSSKKVADIIGVIDEIAFQTNLLALNAAVEAARAGEQGRGFAVVASEVRNLAQRSATAAKEIKELIQDSVSKVDEGGRLVDDTGKTLAEIVGAVKKVSDIIAEIAAASREQAAGIDQVNKAVMQLDEMTQQNAALVEEAAATSESLASQAKNMTEQVGFFVLADGDSVSAPLMSKGERPAPSRPTLASSSSVPPASSGGSMPSPSTKTGTDDDEWEEF